MFKKHNLWAKKRLGQHFLVSRKALSRVLEAAQLKKEDTILEIGPGIGVLTSELLPRVKNVIAIEKDNVMAEALKENTRGFKNLRVIHGDILNLEPEKELPKDYKIVANIPYYITSPFIRRFLEADRRPQLLVLMLQKEVAERIVAKPGKMNILAVSVQFYAEPEIVSFVSCNSFWPKPEVDSAIIKMMPRKMMPRVSPLARGINEKEFFRIVRIGFSSPRKKLVNNLSAGFQISKETGADLLKKIGIESQKRPQDLSLENWIYLYKIFNEYDIL